LQCCPSHPLPLSRSKPCEAPRCHPLVGAFLFPSFFSHRCHLGAGGSPPPNLPFVPFPRGYLPLGVDPDPFCLNVFLSEAPTLEFCWTSSPALADDSFLGGRPPHWSATVAPIRLVQLVAICIAILSSWSPPPLVLFYFPILCCWSCDDPRVLKFFLAYEAGYSL